MIERLRKDMNKVGEHQPGMAMGGYAAGGEAHGDEAQDAEMIKSVLQKIIDEMNGMEADRIMPAHMKPGYAHGDVVAPEHPAENHAETLDEAEPENEANELDQNVLETLMEKAEGAHEDGSTDEDVEADLPPTIVEAIRIKKQQMKK